MRKRDRKRSGWRAFFGEIEEGGGKEGEKVKDINYVHSPSQNGSFTFECNMF